MLKLRSLFAVSLLFLFVSTGLSQIRQTQLFIDDGAGNMEILLAPSGGGTLTLPPGTGTLLSSGNRTKGDLLFAPVNDSIGSLGGAFGNDGYVLTWNNTTSLPEWRASGGWALTGNAGTDTAVNFIGTTDNTPIRFKINGAPAGYIGLATTTDNNLGLGYGTLANLQAGLGDTDNVAIGPYALNSLSGANFGLNTGIGSNSQRNLSPNIGLNTSVGAYAMSGQPGGDPSDNSSVGAFSLHSLHDGDFNSALGASALQSVSDGYDNTAVGYFSGHTITTGSQNTFIGSSSNAASSGLSNATAIGYNASVASNDSIQLGNTSVIAVNTSGVITTGDGAHSGGLMVTDNASHSATLNNANGSTATFSFPTSGGTLATTTSGWALTGNAATDTATNFIGTTDNTPIRLRINSAPAGYVGLATSTDDNVALGYAALAQIQSGVGDTSNTAIGAYALTAISGASFGMNTAVGSNSQRNIASANGENTSVGAFAMFGTPTVNASANTAVGADALYSLHDGGNNACIGAGSLRNTTEGSENVGVGFGSGQTITTGLRNTFVGSEADASSATLTNATAIGYLASVTANNMIQLGNSSVTLVNTSGTITTSRNVIAGTTTGATNARLVVADGHVQSKQTLAPSMSRPAGSGLGSTGNGSVSNATDVAGELNFTPNGSGIASGGMAQLNYTYSYATGPIVVITPADAATAALQPYIQSTSTTDFIVGVVGTPSAGTTYHVYYHVIETQ